MATHQQWKRKAIQPASRPNSEINVTPLVDVVLVLLIIFMVVTPLLEKDIAVKVPDAERVDDTRNTAAEQVIVSLDEKGEIKINAEAVSGDEYAGKLKRILAAKRVGEKRVFFMPHDQAGYGKLITVLDGTKAAGSELLAMMTEVTPEAP